MGGPKFYDTGTAGKFDGKYYLLDSGFWTGLDSGFWTGLWTGLLFLVLLRNEEPGPLLRNQEPGASL